jgi:hypothetical protein
MRQEILHQTELMDRLKIAMEQKKIDLIRALVEEALSLGLSNRLVDDGKHLLEREELKMKLEKELLETSTSNNHELLSSALDKTVQYGIRSDAIHLARVRYEQLKVQRTVIDELRFAMKNIELLRSTEDGLREVDLLSLQDLLHSLEDKNKDKDNEGQGQGQGEESLSAEMKQIQRDGLQTLQRSLKQIEIQVLCSSSILFPHRSFSSPSPSSLPPLVCRCDCCAVLLAVCCLLSVGEAAGSG